MLHFDRSAAARIVADLERTPANRDFANHWMALWDGNLLPGRSSIRPAELKSLLRNLIMFDVVPDRRVLVRLAGTSYNTVLGMELSGEDWIALAPEQYKAERLRIFSDIAAGAIGRGLRKIALKTGDYVSAEEILLPFQGDANSPKLVVCHLDWQLDPEFAGIASREQAWGAPLAFETILLPLARAALTADETGARTR
jgi:hypothetical protein